MADDEREHIYAQVQERYQVGPGYTRLYLQPWLDNPEHTFHSLDDILSAPPPLPRWVDFALSTNQRGQEVVKTLEPHLPVGAQRALDVGCGFGGFVVALSRKGLETYGIEIDPYRIQLAEANCQDSGLSGRVTGTSLLDPNLVKKLGRFDVITCNDVIEHVPDVPLALRNLADLLNPGGILFMEIPNKDALSAVGRDGHFELFGITQLEHADAEHYHQAFYHFPYDVGEYFPLRYYQDELTSHGCSTQVLNPPGSLRVQAAPALRSLVQGWRRYRREHKSRLTPGLRKKVSRAASGYAVRMVWAAAANALSSSGRRRLHLRYLDPFWALLATKSK